MGCGGSKAAGADVPADAAQKQENHTSSAASQQSSVVPASQAGGVEARDVAATTAGGAVAAAATSAPKAKVLVVYYSMYGHIRQLAEGVAAGLNKDKEIDVTIAQVAETLPADVLEKMHAPPKADHPVLDPSTLDQYDGIIIGAPTRFGMVANQVKAMFDATGSLWQSGALRGKAGGLFVTTATQAGGQETTPLTAVTLFTHHGMVYVPFGYGYPALQFDNSTAHGGSPYGPGSLAGADGSGQPSEEELNMCSEYGAYFGSVAKALKVGKAV